MTTEISKIIGQDVKAAYLAFQNDDFRLVNIFANRIMTNAILSEDPRLTLVGFFLKEIAGIYGGIKARKNLSTFSTAKSLGEAYMKSIRLESDINDFWERYHQFRNRIKEHQQDEYERGAYEEDVGFTRLAFRWLIKKLSEDRDVLLKANNQFIRGVLSEMDRIFRAHGGDLVDLYALSLVRALQLYSNYMDYFSKDERDVIVKKSLLPHIDEVNKILLKDHIDQKEVALLLRRIILDWRLCYIHFMERPRLVPIQEERKVPISEETKKKISETVAKALEEEVK